MNIIIYKGKHNGNNYKDVQSHIWWNSTTYFSTIKNNEIIHGLKNEIKLPEQDLENFAKCKKKNIREKCKCN